MAVKKNCSKVIIRRTIIVISKTTPTYQEDAQYLDCLIFGKFFLCFQPLTAASANVLVGAWNRDVHTVPISHLYLVWSDELYFSRHERVFSFCGLLFPVGMLRFVTLPSSLSFKTGMSATLGCNQLWQRSSVVVFLGLRQHHSSLFWNHLAIHIWFCISFWPTPEYLSVGIHRDFRY